MGNSENNGHVVLGWSHAITNVLTIINCLNNTIENQVYFYKPRPHN